MHLSWKPRRNGEMYCAPACGGKCTYVAYLKAESEGRRVKLMLDNPHGWKVMVHENLGWHVHLQKRGLSLHWDDHAMRTYSLLWNETPYRGGHFKHPKEAIENWVKVTSAYVKRCAEVIAAVKP